MFVAIHRHIALVMLVGACDQKAEPSATQSAAAPASDPWAGTPSEAHPSELGGFDVSGPVAIADILARVGAGEYRVSAYGFEPRGVRWEVFVRLGEEPS
jgi:hypothetical protein